jgi:hypothetical protein
VFFDVTNDGRGRTKILGSSNSLAVGFLSEGQRTDPTVDIFSFAVERNGQLHS